MRGMLVAWLALSLLPGVASLAVLPSDNAPSLPLASDAQGKHLLEQAFARIVAFQEQTAPTPDLTDSETVDASVAGLGDLDGDGKGELLLLTSRRSSNLNQGFFETTARAISGNDLATPLWTLEGLGFAAAVPDLNADGTPDLIASGSSTFDYNPDGTLPNTLVTSSYSYSSRGNYALLSGVDGTELGLARFDFSSASEAVRASAVVAFAQAGPNEDSFLFQGIVAPSTLLEVNTTSRSASLYASAVVTGFGQSVSENDVQFRILDLAGNEKARLAYAEPGREGLSVDSLNLGPGKTGLLASWLEGALVPTPLGTVQVGKVHLTAVGETGTQLWDRVLAETQHQGGILLQTPLPDLDGDGAHDLQVVVGLVDPQAGQGARIEAFVLSAATGAVLNEQRPNDGRVRLFLPFGDIDGDGGAEMLAADLSLFDFAGGVAEILAVKSDFSEVWRIDYDESFTVSASNDPFVPRFADWTGDGAPELALLTLPTDKGSALRVIDGRDGTVAWSRDLGKDDDLLVLDDVTGAGEQDLAIARIEGVVEKESDNGPTRYDHSKTTVEYTLLAGESGGTILTQRVRDPENAPLLGNGTVSVATRNVGDLTGDGLTEFTIELGEREQITIEEENYVVTLNYERPTIYVMSLGQAEPLRTIATGPSSNATALPLPAPSQGPALPTSSLATQTAQGTPFPVEAALVALVGVAVALRRRARHL
ncbi:MAG: VCBS repeat-containing protein [Candidatus Thermoplasmatota archaeon]